MAVTVKRIQLWRTAVADRPGALAEVLEPLAAAGSDLQVVMGYRKPGQTEEAVIEVSPVKGRRLTEAAEGAGLVPSNLPALLVMGRNRPRLAHQVARTLGDAEISLSFLVAQTVGRSYSAVFGFESDADANRAATLIRQTAG